MGVIQTQITGMSGQDEKSIYDLVSDNVVDKMSLVEAPTFRHGQLLKPKPKRHCIPRSKFYYDSEEWFQGSTKQCETSNSNVELSKKKSVTFKDEQPCPKDEEESEEYKKYFKLEVPSKVYADTYIRRDAAKWKSTPVPGMRTCTEYDQYRTEAMTEACGTIYEKARGVVPKYGGYVPGLKFRYGSPFGQLTYNARELGIEANKSRTWGGAVSLF